jgi:hypothetical protein
MRITSLVHADDMPSIIERFKKTHYFLNDKGQIILDEQSECDECGTLAGGINTITLEDVWPSVELWCRDNLIVGTQEEHLGYEDDIEVCSGCPSQN